MDPRVAMLANAFSALGGILGVPALLGTLIFGFCAITLSALRRRSEDATSYPKNADAIVLTVLTIGKAIGGAANLLGRFGSGIMTVLAAGSIAVLAFAVLLYAIGRGLDRHEDWARWTAFALMAPVGALAFLGFLTRGRAIRRLAALAILGGAGYATFILWTAFGESV